MYFYIAIALGILVYFLLQFGTSALPYQPNPLPVNTMTNRLESLNSSSTRCPNWYIPSKRNPELCVCGDTLGKILECREDDQRIFVRNLFCMSYDNKTKQPLVASCSYVNIADHDHSNYIQQSQNESKLNEELCGWANREGFMCSKCKDGLGVSVMTYNHACVKCLGNIKGWVLYLFLATVPTTLFFFFVIGCRIRTTSAHMNGIICTFQILAFYLNRYPNSILNSSHRIMYNLYLVTVTISGVWCLDFFRYVIPPFCITEKISTLDVIAMEYIVAIYPLLLIMATYICIELHDKGYKVLIIMWIPFKWILSKISWNIDFRSSIIDTFATFLHLAYSKLIFVSFNLMGHKVFLDSKGEQVGAKVVYYDATIPYLSKSHLPYFILSVIILDVFVVFPMLVLFLYPTKFFQKFLGCFSIQWHPLRAFADAFNGCYKNGTDGTKDYRYFGAFCLLIRVMYYFPALFWEIKTSIFLNITPLTACLMFGILRPYQNDFYNRLDAILYFILTLLHIWEMFSIYIVQLGNIYVQPLILVPFLHLFVLTGYKILSLCAPNTLVKLKKWVNSSSNSRREETGRNDAMEDEDMADRIRNPECYLLPTAAAAVHEQRALVADETGSSYGSIGQQ